MIFNLNIPLLILAYLGIGLVTACLYRYLTKRQAHLIDWLNRVLFWPLIIVEMILMLKKRLERIYF